MKVLSSLWRWLRGLFKLAQYDTSPEYIQVPEQDAEEFQFVIVAEVPTVLAEKCVYILNEGYIDEAIYFVCPCGCDSIIELNLLEDSSPLWRYHVSNNEISIMPSVWRKVGCRSHFFLTKGKIQWVRS